MFEKTPYIIYFRRNIDGKSKTDLYDAIEKRLGEKFFVQDNEIYENVNGKNIKVAEFETIRISDENAINRVTLNSFDKVGNIRGLKFEPVLKELIGKTYVNKNYITKKLGDSYTLSENSLMHNGVEVAKLNFEEEHESGTYHYEIKSIEYVETQEQSDADTKEFSSRETKKTKMRFDFNDIIEKAKQQPFESRAKSSICGISSLKHVAMISVGGSLMRGRSGMASKIYSFSFLEFYYKCFIFRYFIIIYFTYINCIFFR